jgi:hypothetical protein
VRAGGDGGWRLFSEGARCVVAMAILNVVVSTCFVAVTGVVAMSVVV